MATVSTDIAQTLDITHRRGDTLLLNINFKDSSGTALNIDGYTFKMEIRRENTDDVVSGALISTSPTISSAATNGIILINVPYTDMIGLVGGEYVYDIQASNSSGIQTWVTGEFLVEEDVTVGA